MLNIKDKNVKVGFRAIKISPFCKKVKQIKKVGTSVLETNAYQKKIAIVVFAFHQYFIRMHRYE